MIRYPAHADLADLFWSFPIWYRSLEAHHNPLTDEQPWLTFGAIRYLGQILRPEMRVLEYGSGGSTLYFAKRVAKVVSIEHDPDWSTKVTAALAAHGYAHCEIRLILPAKCPLGSAGDPSEPDAYASSDEIFRGFSFLDYASSIDKYDDEYFDLVCIDGRARPSCFKHARPKVAYDGHIVWDNTERDYYKPALQTAGPQWRRLDFHGPIPGLTEFIQTTVLKRERL